jgi:hypothetical protein
MFEDNMTSFSVVAVLLLSVSYEFASYVHANTNKINRYGVLLVVIDSYLDCNLVFFHF